MPTSKKLVGRVGDSAPKKAPRQRSIKNERTRAEAILAKLRSVSPQSATAEAIELCEEANRILQGEPGAMEWAEAKCRLASFLIETPTGNRHENVSRARSLYREVRKQVNLDTNWEAWSEASSGLANSIIYDPAFDSDAFDEAVGMIEALIGRAHERADAVREASFSLNLAQALDRDARGDKTRNTERALTLTRRAARLLSPEKDPERWGRAMHNLGVIFLERKRGVPSQNVDSAIKVLRDALTVRTAEADPAGRVRTLRALAAAYPKWSGADSLDHAAELAEAAEREAAEIEAAHPVAAQRTEGWARFARMKPALFVNLDGMELSTAQLQQLLDEHYEAVQTLPKETMPFEWAQWAGGIGCLLNWARRHGRPELLTNAVDWFHGAISSFSSNDNPRLARDLYRQLGAMCHEVGTWQESFTAHSRAVELAEILFRAAATPESIQIELSEAKGFALFAAYAAARLELPLEAVRLAEIGRSRSLVEASVAQEAALSNLAPEQRAALEAARERIDSLKSRLETATAADPHVEMEKNAAKLADFLGASKGLLKFRVTSAGNTGTEVDGSASEFVRISEEIDVARASLEKIVQQVRTADPSLLPDILDGKEISRVAQAVGFPIVYLLVTVHGAMALVVPPKGNIEALPLSQINSGVTGQLLYGTGQEPGYWRSAAYGDRAALSKVLPGCIQRLREDVIAPVCGFLVKRGHGRAAIVPLGSLGLLPLESASIDEEVVLSYAPSARLLARACGGRDVRRDARPTLLAVGNPASDSRPPLPFAAAEARRVAQMIKMGGTDRVLLGAGAQASRVRAAIPKTTHLHLACHGRFRPADPLESSLFLAGDETVTLRELLRGTSSLPLVQLAVLSACQSASVEAEQTPDETLGFPAALLLAGVPSVVCTLWEVDDRAAALFCQHFYELHLEQRVSPAAAVRSAQRWLRDATADKLVAEADKLKLALLPEDESSYTALSDFWLYLLAQPAEGKPPFSDPYYWAPFSYTGV